MGNFKSSRLVLALSVVQLACTAADGGEELDRPSDLADCFSGLFFADCGGEAAPVFGCDNEAACRWFVGGIAPMDHFVSDCPTQDLCCHQGFPFEADEPLFDEWDHFWIVDQLWAWGHDSWTIEREMNLTATIDPIPEQSTSITCSREGQVVLTEGPCNQNVAVIELHDTLVAVYGDLSGAGWYLVVEIDIREPSDLKARACRSRYHDVRTATCREESAPSCATSGTVRMSTIPAADNELAGLRLDVTAMFSDGLELTATW